MFPDDLVINLSRLQFALTAMYHFLFVPLTLGLSVLLAVMETVYVMTGREVWKRMVKFWGLLFGINFVMGVATGITLEFQFGTNWAYYSHYVGDVFGAPLALEGLMAFFLEATFVGLFFFGWDRLSKHGHLIVTWLLALGTNLSALWILIANGWMNNPVGSYFDHETLRMQVSSFTDILFNPVAQAKFVHTISAGYVTGAMFVLSISAYYLLRKRNVGFAKRSMTVAASFGLASALSVVVLGDESGYLANENQKMKIAVMEGMWETESTPASFALFGIPDEKEQQIKYEIKVPYALGIIATRSFSEPVLGINDLIDDAEQRIYKGVSAYAALQQLQVDPNDESALAVFNENQSELGYAFLLKRYTADVLEATPQQVRTAAEEMPPKMTPLFFAFRFMVLCGFYFIFLFALAFYLASRRRLDKPWFLRMALWSLPLPWLAAEAGWFVAEYGRQPWVVEGMLPTGYGVSSLTAGNIMVTLAGFIIFYTVLAVVELFLMVKYIRIGPEGMQTSSAQTETINITDSGEKHAT